MSTRSTAPLLRLEGIGHRYGSSWVLEDIDLRFGAGECTSLVGENGAGKSTLLRILSGQIRPSAGRVLIDGEEVSLGSARDARSAGIVVIPQELAYVPRMTVAENLMIGRWPGVARLTTRRQVETAAAEVVSHSGFELDVSSPMTELPLADRQLVEIIKVISTEARLILLDEPTASLTDSEATRLFSILDSLRKRGTSLVYVSHRLDECMRVADRFAVLRSGRLVMTAPRPEVTTDSLVEAMLGEAVGEVEHGSTPPAGQRAPRFVLRDWNRKGTPGIHNVSLSVAGEEIVVLFGLVGSGVEAIAQALGGIGEAVTGSLEIDGRRMPAFSNPRQAWTAGVAYVPAERKRDGLVLSQSIRANLALRRPPTRFGLLRERSERRWATATATEWRVHHAGVDQPVGDLSGGNQQKVLLASRLVESPRVLVLHEPTRGVDIGARIELHEQIRNVARDGAAVIAVTSDIDEALALGHRIDVVRAGRIVAELEGEERAPSRVLAVAASAEDAR